MKFSSIGRGTLASILSLSACLGVTACSRDFTVAYLYSLATKTTTGLLNVYKIDYQSGALTQLPDSPVQTGGMTPESLVATSDEKNLYVANMDSNNITWFKLGTDGQAYPQPQINTMGSKPLAMALSGDQKTLYVLCKYREGASPSATGPGEIDAYPINSDNSLNTSTAIQINVGLNPVGLTASADGNFVYVIHRDTNTANNLIGFSRNTSTGALTALTGTTVTSAGATGYASGSEPSAIAEDLKSRYVYVTDRALNQVIAYTISSTGVPVPLANGPFSTGSYPVALTIDPRNKYLYTVNYNSNSLSAFAIDTATGTLSASAGSTSVQTDTGPTCVSIEPALGIYLYTTNTLASTITALQLNPSTGSLKNVQNTPFTTSALPSCLTTVANGDHATQINP